MAEAIAKRLSVIKDRAGVSSREIAQLLGTTPETVSRWNTGKGEPKRARLQRLLTLVWLVEQLSEFYAPEEAKLWLFAPHRLLDGDRPVDRIQEGKLDDALALIDQLRSGAYV